MKSRWQLIALLLCLSSPLYGQTEAQLREFFEGKMIVAKIDMPGSSDGIDIQPETKPEIDYDKHLRNLRRFGIAVQRGESIIVSKVRVKDDMIEFQLGGGGLGFQGSTVPRFTPAAKGEREARIEGELDQEQDPRRKREISQELNYLRREREQQDRRTQEQIDKIGEEVQKRRREGGSRLNIRYKKKVPPEALTPEGLMRVLANYVEFSANTFGGIAKSDVNVPGNTRIDRPRRTETNESGEPALGPRVALVMGNGAYKDTPLTNPVSDARDIAATLSNLGFEVTKVENQTQTEMKRAIRAFGEKLRKSAVGLFYYAGHGVQVKGQNYMIPVGAVIDKEEEVEYEGVDVGLLLAQMENAGNRVNIVILDACRNNPFARSFRSATRGLAVVSAPTGTLIAYST
ncbi:MAG: caspase family protein, partial [Acidobacteria bacterium]|nr:caspase family protein [Acidobacteriota bacterium]